VVVILYPRIRVVLDYNELIIAMLEKAWKTNAFNTIAATSRLLGRKNADGAVTAATVSLASH
jgi:hypothetical protein